MENTTKTSAKGPGRIHRINAISLRMDVFLMIVFAIFSVLCILPLCIILGSSLTDNTSILSNGYNIIPHVFSTYAYTYLFKDPSTVIRSYGVTIFNTVVGTVISVLVMSMYAYSLWRRDFRYSRGFTFFLFVTMLFSGGLIPTYIVVTQFAHLGDTIWVMVLLPAFNGFWVIVMRTFYKTAIPFELVESAKIDGAGEFRIFFRIVYPLAVPGLATVALMQALVYWNDFFTPLLYLTKNQQQLQNLQYMMYSALMKTILLMQIAQKSSQTTLLNNIPAESFRLALAVVAIGPLVLVYPFFQRFFIKGLTIGAVKG